MRKSSTALTSAQSPTGRKNNVLDVDKECRPPSSSLDFEFGLEICIEVCLYRNQQVSAVPLLNSCVMVRYLRCRYEVPQTGVESELPMLDAAEDSFAVLSAEAYCLYW